MSWWVLTVASFLLAGPPDWVHYWDLPLAPQGPPAEGLVDLEVSLRPEACGACHPTQLADWWTSLHARAMSEGLRAELAAGMGDERCLYCHAPLAEQRQDADLRGAGIVCAACHLRGRLHHGPRGVPRHRALGAPHTVARGEIFRDAAFCAPCHQQPEGRRELAGKPLMNTVREWQQGPASTAEQTCQACHMPNGRHLWRGVHDPEMVSAAVSVEADTNGTIRVTNHAGHRVPSYVVPIIWIRAWLEDDAGHTLPGSQRNWALQRSVVLAGERGDEEVFDTRLAPGEVRLLSHGGDLEAAAALVVRVEVEPDAYYRALYARRLKSPRLVPEVRSLYESALNRPLVPPYLLPSIRRPLR